MSGGKTVTWNAIEPFPLVLISGPESYLASRALGKLKTLLRNAHPNLEITHLADGEYSPGLLVSLAAPSLFSEPRLIVIQSGSEGLLEDLQQYLDLQVEDCVVVVRIPNAVGQNGKIRTSLAKQALNVSCEELKKDADRVSFIQGEFSALGVSVEAAATKALLTAFANDLGELGAACSQLVASGVPKITAALVESTFQGRVETNSFKIADAALNGEASEAIRLFRHGFATGIDNVALVAALTMRIRTLAKLFNNQNSQAAALGLAPWQLDKARRELRNFSEEQLIGLVQMAAQVDADVKGASRDPEYSVEQLILAMASK